MLLVLGALHSVVVQGFSTSSPPRKPIRRLAKVLMEAEKLTVPPISKFTGKITLPGSKSLSNRVLLLSALSEGTTMVENLLDSADIRYMLDALKQLQVQSMFLWS